MPTLKIKVTHEQKEAAEILKVFDKWSQKDKPMSTKLFNKTTDRIVALSDEEPLKDMLALLAVAYAMRWNATTKK